MHIPGNLTFTIILYGRPPLMHHYPHTATKRLYWYTFSSWWRMCITEGDRKSDVFVMIEVHKKLCNIYISVQVIKWNCARIWNPCGRTSFTASWFIWFRIRWRDFTIPESVLKKVKAKSVLLIIVFWRHRRHIFTSSRMYGLSPQVKFITIYVVSAYCLKCT